MPISEYLAEIRYLVGHRELCLPGVTAIIRNPAKSILFVRNYGENEWTLPGGLIEPAESPATAIVREIKEELNVNLKIESLLGVFSGPEYRVIYPNADKAIYITSVFGFSINWETLTPDGVEIEESKFVNMNDFLDLNAPPWVRDIITKVQNGIQY